VDWSGKKIVVCLYRSGSVKNLLTKQSAQVTAISGKRQHTANSAVTFLLAVTNKEVGKLKL